jgi:hypothetical protein
MATTLTLIEMSIAAVALLGTGLCIGVVIGRHTADSGPSEFQRDLAIDDDEVGLPQPDLKGSWVPFSGYLNVREYIKKRRKLLNSGYVEWYLVEDGIPKPRFIKPTAKDGNPNRRFFQRRASGGGTPEYEHKGTTYLFPRNGGVPNEQQGLLTYFHTKGDAQPIDLRDPPRPALDPDALKELFDRRVTSDEPSFLERLDLDLSPQMIMAGGIVAIALVSVLMGGV